MAQNGIYLWKKNARQSHKSVCLELLMSPVDKLISLCTTYLRQPMLAFKLSFKVSLKAMFFTFGSLFTGCYFDFYKAAHYNKWTRKLLNPAKLYSFAQYAFLSHGYSIQTRPRLQYLIVTYDERYQNYVLLGCNLYSVNLFSLKQNLYTSTGSSRAVTDRRRKCDRRYEIVFPTTLNLVTAFYCKNTG